MEDDAAATRVSLKTDRHEGAVQTSCVLYLQCRCVMNNPGVVVVQRLDWQQETLLLKVEF